MPKPPTFTDLPPDVLAALAGTDEPPPDVLAEILADEARADLRAMTAAAIQAAPEEIDRAEGELRIATGELPALPARVIDAVLSTDEPLTLDLYAYAADATAIYPDRRREHSEVRSVTPGLCYAVFGLLGEAGEIAEKIKKALRDDGGRLTSERLDAIELEIGDLLWYIAAACHETGHDLEAVARANLGKLAGRAARGTLKGDGDSR